MVVPNYSLSYTRDIFSKRIMKLAPGKNLRLDQNKNQRKMVKYEAVMIECLPSKQNALSSNASTATHTHTHTFHLRNARLFCVSLTTQRKALFNLAGG
jgi:hypothetical protein